MLVLCPYSSQLKRKCSGVSVTLQVEHSGEVSVSVLLFWPFGMEFPVLSLAILEIPFLVLFFRRMALSVNFLWDMLGTMFLYFVCFEFSHVLFHLLMKSILVPCCISEGDGWVLGCRFAFFEAVFASESALSFSSIPWWALGSIQIYCCVALLDWCPWGSHKLLLQWMEFSLFWENIVSIADWQSENISGLEELKIWMHIFSCTPIQVCVHVVHVNYLCMHMCMQIVYGSVLLCDYVLYINIFLVLYHLILYYIKICDSC